MTKPCNNHKCCTSTGICESTTHGSGILDEHGYWQFPCFICAREYEKQGTERHWPFPGQIIPPMEVVKTKCVDCGKEFEQLKGTNFVTCHECHYDWSE